MSDEKEVLSQEEVSALMEGVSNNTIETDSNQANEDYKLYDFSSQERIIKGLSGIYAINERFVRAFRGSLIDLFHRPVEVIVNEISTLKSSQVMSSLKIPSFINVIRMRPLVGTALAVFNQELVYTLVNIFFGGTNTVDSKQGTKTEFTRTENRIVEVIMQHIFKDLKEAWSTIIDLNLDTMETEINPALINTISPSEIIVLMSYSIKFENFGGNLFIVIPYSLIEPVRSALEIGNQQYESQEVNEHWAHALREEIFDAQVKISGSLAEANCSLKDIQKMKAGDVIPIEMMPHVTVLAEGTPLFRAKFGVSNNRYSIKITGRVSRE